MSGANFPRQLLNPSQFSAPQAPTLTPYASKTPAGKQIGTMSPFMPNQFLVNQLSRLNNVNPYQRLGMGYSFNPNQYTAPAPASTTAPATTTPAPAGTPYIWDPGG